MSAIFKFESYALSSDAFGYFTGTTRERVEMLSQLLAEGRLPHDVRCYTSSCSGRKETHLSVPANPQPGTVIETTGYWVIARFYNGEWHMLPGRSVKAPGITSDEVPVIAGRETVTSDSDYQYRKNHFGA